MGAVEITLIVIAGVILVGVVPAMIPPYIIAKRVYKDILVRTSKDKWGRCCSDTTNEEQVEMYSRGEKWAEPFKGIKQDVQIENDGFKLVGEYFDFGAKKTVIIVPGRTEGCDYSYYFAKPYKDSGFNVLVIDNRCHGLSEGTYPTLGDKECRDIIKWGQLLHDQFGNEEVVLHGICIGSATCLYALCEEDCPDYFKYMVADGMYTTFSESFKNHLIKDGHMVFPFNLYIMMLLKKHTGTNAITDGPYYRIKNLKKPILFLYSKQDEFSKPDKAQILYDKCPSQKKLVWFDKGAHSHIRINAEEAYDAAIKDFVKEIDG